MREIIRQKIIDFMAQAVPLFTRRDIVLPSIPGKAVAVIGMRRTGKTTFLWQILAGRMVQNTKREGLLYFSFEDERLAQMTVSDIQLVLEEYYRLYPQWRDQKRAVFFLDEIQTIQGWESFARRILDTEKIELFISGSSAKLLSREVATSMRGRAMECLVHPFGFREYLRHHNREPESVHFSKAVRSALEKDLRAYLVSGGFPEAQGTSVRDRFALLRNYVDVVLLRDIIERHEVSHPVALRWLLRQLLGNAAGSFSINKFYNDLRSQGIPVAKDTLHAYLDHLEDAFLIRTLSVASNSERRRMVNPRKIYPIDPGLIPVFDRSNQSQLGHALETCVVIELERRDAEVAYVRTENGFEVDFLAQYPDGHTDLIQVCADFESQDTKEREIRALLDASVTYPHARLHLITLHVETWHGIPDNISTHSIIDWLLNPHL